MSNEMLNTRPDSLNQTQFLLTGITLHINFRGLPNGFLVSADSDARFTHYYIDGKERSWNMASRPEKTLAYNSLYHIYVAAPIASGKEARIEMYVTEKTKQPDQAYITDNECYLFKVGELTASEVSGSEDLIPRGLRSPYFGNESVRGEKIIGRMTSASGNSFIDWDCDSFQFGDPNGQFYFQWNVEAGVAVLKGILILDSHGQKVDIGSFLGGSITDSFLESLAQNIRLDRYFDLEKVEMQVAQGGLTLGGEFTLRKKISESGFEITASVDGDGNARFKSLTIGSDFVPGFIGGIIDNQANAELKSLTLREFLNVPELRYNRVSVIAGEQWSAPGGGIIEEVNIVDSIVYLKLEKGESATIAAEDICKGIFNTGTGFQTSFFKVVEVLSGMDHAGFIYQLKPGTTVHPQAFMHFVAYGNFTITSRQASAVQTREYLRFMAGVDTWDISADMIKAHIGNMSGMSINGTDFSGYSGLLRNFYFDGTLAQLAPAIADSEQNTKDYVDDKTAAENLALQNFIDNTYTQEMLAMQAQIDGQLESFFFQQDPTLTNAPANGWVTTIQKESHLNDTYTNLSTGKSWRWSNNGSTYGWVVIADTATEKALQIAGQAKDTADSKRRTFIVTPYTPYNTGDLWVTSGGELMKCVVERLNGNYTASDWIKATKYTDDSAVENLQIGGRNLLRYSGNFKDTSNITGAGFSSVDHFDGYIVCKTIASVGYEQWAYLKLKYPVQKLEKGTYTLSIRVRGSRSFVRLLEIATDGGQSAIAGRNINISTSWSVYSFQFNLTENYTAAIDHFARIICANDQNGDWRDNDWIDVAWFKLEKGSKATDWNPAPEDVQSGIDDAKETGAAYNTMGEY
ncbi:MAG: hypothetical protein RR346_09015, partial [Bacteroidales bacterium]